MKTIFRGSKFRVTSPFGPRTMGGSTQPHNGIDLVGIDDKTVCSACAGTVSKVQKWDGVTKSGMQSYGNLVIVEDSAGDKYYYAHLSSIKVSAGEKVAAGDVLGVMGNTGNTTGPHTHFEIRGKNNKAKNPAAYLGVPNQKGEYNANTEPDGWIKRSGGRWQYRKNGKILKGGWVKDNGFWYYLKPNSYMATGMYEVDGKLYYFNEERRNNIPTGACVITDGSGVVGHD